MPEDAINISTRDEKKEPLNPNPLPPPTPRLNERLRTEYIDLDKQDDSCGAMTTRGTANVVARWFTPQQVIGILRLLKAITFCFLILTMVADLMYVLFVEIMSSHEYRAKAGGFRDIMIRVYGLAFAVIIVGIELENKNVIKRFSGLKPFIPRGLMMLFIAVITGSHPKDDGTNAASYNDDDANNEEYQQQEDYQIPRSALAFQMVTSCALGICSIGYILCGMMCFDRFKPKAFLSMTDPRVTTSIIDPLKDPRIRGTIVQQKPTKEDPV